MDVFSFDQRYFFQRQPTDDCWYAFTQFATAEDYPDMFRHGYFGTMDGRFVRHGSDGRDFGLEQIQEIENILSQHRAEMDLSQFDAHRVLPTHYRELGAKTGRYSDVFGRLRASWYDPDFAVAFNHLTNEEPTYRLTREFVQRLLERAARVSSEERENLMRERLLAAWTYDVEREVNRTTTFEEFFKKEVIGLAFPKPIKRRDGYEYRLFEVKGLPRVYLLSRECDVPKFDGKLIDSCHYLDRDSSVLPIALPSHGSLAYYIL